MTINITWWCLRGYMIFYGYFLTIFLGFKCRWMQAYVNRMRKYGIWLKKYEFYLVILFIAMSILLYEYTIWALTKYRKKKLDGNYTRMLRTVLNKSWKQYPTNNSSCTLTYIPSHKPFKHDKHIKRGTPRLGLTSVDWPVKIYIHQLCVDTGCSLENRLLYPLWPLEIENPRLRTQSFARIIN